MNDFTVSKPSNPPSVGAVPLKKAPEIVENDIPPHILPVMEKIELSGVKHTVDVQNIQELKKTIDTLEGALNHLEFGSKTLDVFISGQEVNELTSKTTEVITDLFGISSESITRYENTSSAMTLVAASLEMLLGTSQLILKSELIKTKKEELGKISDDDPLKLKMEKEIKKMDGEMQKMIKKFALANFINAPAIADQIYKFINHLKHAAGIVAVSSGLGIVSSFLSIILPTHDFCIARKIKKLHLKATRDLDPVVVTIVKASEVYMGTAPLLKKQQDTFKNRMNASAAKNIQEVQKQEALTGMAKAQLKERLGTVEKTNQQFFQFKEAKSIFNLAVSTISAILAIDLAIFMLAGISFPPALVIVPTVLSIVAGIGLLGVGIYYLHKQKPNLAKVLFKGTKISIVLNQVLLFFINLQLEKYKKKEQEIENKINSIAFADSLEKVKENVSYYEGLQKKFDGKIKDLENEIKEARIADYSKKMGVKSKDFQDEFSIIAASLVTGKFWFDEEAKALIEKYGGEKLKKEVNADEPNIDPAELALVLRDLILRSSEDVIKWIKDQKTVNA